MRIPFRHGLIRYQKSGPFQNFLHQSNSGSTISLYVDTTSTVIAFAHGTSDYLYEEKRSISPAWTGPFVSGTDYWLYWDINMLTGQRTFGHTTLQPVLTGPAPIVPNLNQHWFDHATDVMKVWAGSSWTEVLRVFACKYDEGAIIQEYFTGSQVGILTPSYPGSILFDANSDPIRRIRGGNRRSEFITTESVLSTKTATGLTNITVEARLPIVEAIENIPAFRLVAYKDNSKIGLASSNDQSHTIVGIVQEDFYTSEVGTFVSSGSVTNEEWVWTELPGTPLFCGLTGNVTTIVPQTGGIQQIGHIVSTSEIFLDIEQPILYNPTVSNPILIHVDKATGKMVAKHLTSFVSTALGYLFTTNTALTTWNINHGLGTTNIVYQIYDGSYSKIIENSFQIINANNVQITFSSPQAGYAHLVVFGT